VGLDARSEARSFGRIDTWVNNAGISIYGRIHQVPLEDARRLFATNYWGVVHGSLAALPYLERSHGTLINVGSVLSETAYALQGHYVASKHAVKGFTESLRVELEADDVDVAVTLIEPAAIDTPYPIHARSYLGVEPQHLPPVYAPEAVAEAILHCAERPMRTLQVGGGTKMFSLMETFTPWLADRFKAATLPQQYGDRPDRRQDTLYAPRPGDGRARGFMPPSPRGSASAYAEPASDAWSGATYGDRAYGGGYGGERPGYDAELESPGYAGRTST
jgi:short-subunit dehydrogenase